MSLTQTQRAIMRCSVCSQRVAHDLDPGGACDVVLFGALRYVICPTCGQVVPEPMQTPEYRANCDRVARPHLLLLVYHANPSTEVAMSAEHDQLMQEWEHLPHHKNQCFIRDGIIDMSRWQTANRKVLFLLREAYDRKKRPDGFDLCQVIREKWKGPKTKTWWTVANWAFAAIHGTSDRIPPLTEDSKQQRREALLSAAVVNLKKSKGVSESDLSDIASHAREDAELIRRQIEIIDPQIVICGNTWKAARHIWESDAEPIYYPAFRVGHRTFISFWHPANRWPKRLNYYAMGCILQNCGALSN